MTYETLSSIELKKSILDNLQDSISKGKTVPKLCVVLVWDNPASLVYVKNKQKACESIGMEFALRHFPEWTQESEILENIEEINRNPEIHGCIVQLPLPTHINPNHVIDAIDARKDVDGFSLENIGKLFLGRSDGLISCTPKGILRLLENYGHTPTGKHVVIIGRSNIVGKPLSLLLLNKGATVTVCHSKTKDLAKHTLSADILIVAIGKSKFITADMVKSWAVVIDVGMNRDPDTGKLAGDVDFENIIKKAHCSPVPGGVGPMTIAMLLENTVQSCQALDMKK